MIVNLHISIKLFIEKLFGANLLAKLISLTIFTFAAMLLSNGARPYASQYAATSLGSMLYGSFYGGVSVSEYIPIRVMLIFIGVVLFLCVEMLVFPRSSKTVVQGQSLQFFEDTETFLSESSKLVGSLSSIQSNKNKEEENDDDMKVSLSEIHRMWMMQEGHKKYMPSISDDLSASRDAVVKTITLYKSELGPSLLEPSFGLNISLDTNGYRNLLTEQGIILSQIDLLIDTVKALIGYYSHLSEDHYYRSFWPSFLSISLNEISEQLNNCQAGLQSVFPLGLISPGACDLSEIIRAVAEFRNFEDDVLTIHNKVADRYTAYANSIQSSGGESALYIPGFRLTLSLAVSAILTIGKSLSKCGTHLATIVQSFPVDKIQKDMNRNLTALPIDNVSTTV